MAISDWYFLLLAPAPPWWMLLSDWPFRFLAPPRWMLLSDWLFRLLAPPPRWMLLSDWLFRLLGPTWWMLLSDWLFRLLAPSVVNAALWLVLLRDSRMSFNTVKTYLWNPDRLTEIYTERERFIKSIICIIVRLSCLEIFLLFSIGLFPSRM